MSKVKVQITMEDDLLDMLDNYCDKNYMNRSVAISQAVSQVVMQQKLIDSLTDLSYAIKICSEKGEIDTETQTKIKEFEILAKMVSGN